VVRVELVAALEPESAVLAEALAEWALEMEMEWAKEVLAEASVALDCRNQHCSGTP
jgi:hypothetical protein